MAGTEARASHVLRIPRSDEAGSFILARVTPSGPASRPLDARLAATEGVAPYVLTLRHDRIDRLRSQNAPCSAEEWKGILAFLLLGQGAAENIDATATVQEESALTITVRKRVENITQRLGTLSLAYDADEGIELFEWCGEVVERSVQAVASLAAAQTEKAAVQAAVDELKAQLDEFLATKAADETVMLEKFCKLLNEKKAKIRQQQRQLAEAADQNTASAEHAADIAEIKEEEEGEDEGDKMEEDEEAAPPPTHGRRGGRAAARGRLGKAGSAAGKGAAKAGPARRGAKRRIAAAASDDEDEDEFEAPAATTAAADDGSSASDEDERTTENDDESTESEPEAEANDIQEDGPQQTAPAAAAAASVGAPPPRRTLAFGKARAAAPAAAAPTAPTAAAAGGSETDSDDEL